MFTSLEIHEFLLNQIGNSKEISDYRNDSVIISESTICKDQKGLIVIDNIPKNSVIFSFRNEVTHARTQTSIQVSADSHIEPSAFGMYANHSCKPNCCIYAQLRDNGASGHIMLIATEPIAKGEEITFDYASTEIELTPELRGTKCLCRQFGCRITMKGYVDLTEKERKVLDASNHVLGHIKQLVVTI